MKSKFTHTEESPGFLLWKLTTAWQRKLRQALSVFKLSHIEFVYLACLQYLTQYERELTQAQLARHAQLDKMVISDTTQKLLKKQLIMRQDHRQDTRSYAIKLTAKGRELVDCVLPIVEQVDQHFFNKYKKQIKLLGKIANKTSV